MKNIQIYTTQLSEDTLRDYSLFNRYKSRLRVDGMNCMPNNLNDLRFGNEVSRIKRECIEYVAKNIIDEYLALNINVLDFRKPVIDDEVELISDFKANGGFYPLKDNGETTIGGIVFVKFNGYKKII